MYRCVHVEDVSAEYPGMFAGTWVKCVVVVLGCEAMNGTGKVKGTRVLLTPAAAVVRMCAL